MNLLRDAIAAVIADDIRTMQADADAVLATPEMQAIRSALRDTYKFYGADGAGGLEDFDVVEMELDGLPEAVIDWVVFA